MYTHQKKYATAGTPAKDAGAALVMIHGRGGTAQNIISLAQDLNVANMAIYAPQAANNSWYPYSFMAQDKQNQPALDSALEVIDELVKQIVADGIPEEKIYFIGFSQGACLTLEYITRNAKQYGGAVAFTGGLIGEELNLANYTGDFNHTPILITTGNPDPHVPLGRVEDSVKVLQNLNADVTLKVYNGRPHTITQQEIDLANELVFG
ncbi:alpha/beta hydrolase [Mucilaginibacter sp. FT3.2]|uniref:alpha/beta hydrolase n=1 Tax=Mucilaginibacter sp. FT3.2 TaxID=2723090 RepID=UPI0016214040|nr:dienelactone hydrolase family protein [Mucilaginibacter sp. FT3.2]MBB6235378.1 phospholipase/carboxylesterase [Mucilaginibacter sp. FT3.2]